MCNPCTKRRTPSAPSLLGAGHCLAALAAPAFRTPPKGSRRDRDRRTGELRLEDAGPARFTSQSNPCLQTRPAMNTLASGWLHLPANPWLLFIRKLTVVDLPFEFGRPQSFGPLHVAEVRRLILGIVPLRASELGRPVLGRNRRNRPGATRHGAESGPVARTDGGSGFGETPTPWPFRQRPRQESRTVEGR